MDGTFEIEEDEPLALTKKVNKDGAREFEIVDSKTGKISLFLCKRPTFKSDK